jgi:CHASE3 domain sensor protein
LTPVTITAAPPSRPPARRGGVARVIRIRSLPGRIRAVAFLAILAVAAVFAVAGLAVQDARDGLRVIGHDAGPQVVATGDLYFALSDMDAQLAAVLLMGRENLGGGRDRALQVYDQRRSQAHRALLQGSNLARDDPAEQQTARSVLDALGRYEQLAGQALQLDQRQSHAAGPPSQEVGALYGQATDLMKLDVLPKAYNLTLDNGTTVRRTYESKHSAVLAGRAWVLLAGAVLLLVLVGLQVYLAMHFRRLVNPVLALATVASVVLIAATVGLLTSEASHLRKAKDDGFDSVLSLSRARAISNNANADETRYLLQPSLADTYEQVYLDKSQEILYVPAGNLAIYYKQLDQRLAGRSFLGFLGVEAQHVTLPGQNAALDRTLRGYQGVQRDDGRIRSLATSAGGRHAAIALRMDIASRDFGTYDQALVSLTAIHQKAFTDAIRAGDDGLSGWNVGLPAAVIVIAVLVLAGVRPRLSEFR